MAFRQMGNDTTMSANIPDAGWVIGQIALIAIDKAFIPRKAL